jgi:hypothetical protein
MKQFSGEQGSIAPLAIGLALIWLAAVIAVTMASTLFIFQKRLTNLAEASALVAANGEAAVDFVSQVPGLELEGLTVQQTTAADEITIDVRVCATWQSPIQILKVFATSQICSHASARQEPTI